MFGAAAVVGTFELDEVQIVFIAVDGQRDLRDVTVVDPEASNAPFSRPATQVTGPFREAIVEPLCLLFSFAGQATKDRSIDDGRRR